MSALGLVIGLGKFPDIGSVRVSVRVGVRVRVKIGGNFLLWAGF